MRDRVAATGLVLAVVAVIAAWFLVSSSAFVSLQGWVGGTIHAVRHELWYEEAKRVAALILLPLVVLGGALVVVGWLGRNEAGRRGLRAHWPWFGMALIELLSFGVTVRLLNVLLPDTSGQGHPMTWAALGLTFLMGAPYFGSEWRRWDRDHDAPVSWQTTPLIFRVWMLVALATAAAVWMWAMLTLPWDIPMAA